MKAAIFREYDIRGIFGVDLLVETTYDLARAIAAYIFIHNPSQRTIIVGMDVRTHSPLLHAELCRGLQDSGYHILDLGVCTSPMVYFATHTLSCAGAIIVTASHNPKEYNGFKIVVGKEALWGSAIQEIKKLYQERACITFDGTPGSYTTYDSTQAYCTWLVEQFPRLKHMQMPVLFDCANGAASVIMPAVVKAFSWTRAQLLYATPDGTFPNHPADPIEMHNMQDLWFAMRTQNCAIGIGFDGDADRMDALDEQGNLIPGDKLLAIFARHIAQEHNNLKVVCDITASAGLLSLLQEFGAEGIVAPCGSGIIKKYMRDHKALLGGELSCHFFFADRGFGFDDGIYAALRLLEIMVITGQSLAELNAAFPNMVSSPQFRVVCAEDLKQKVVSVATTAFTKREDTKVITLDGARISFPYGWGLVRASNTQPVVVFRFESDTESALRGLKKEFADLLSAEIGLDLHTIFGI